MTEARRVRWRCPECFWECLSAPPAPVCGCRSKGGHMEWATMEQVIRARRVPKEERIAVLRRGFGVRDRSEGRSDYIGRPWWLR